MEIVYLGLTLIATAVGDACVYYDNIQYPRFTPFELKHKSLTWLVHRNYAVAMHFRGAEGCPPLMHITPSLSDLKPVSSFQALGLDFLDLSYMSFQIPNQLFQIIDCLEVSSLVRNSVPSC